MAESVSKLLYSATMSLDGFIAGPNGDMSWLTDLLIRSDPEIDDLIGSIGALLVGSNTFTGDDPNAGTDAEGAFGGQWHGPTIVLTHHPLDSPTDPDVVFATDLDSAVSMAKAAPTADTSTSSAPTSPSSASTRDCSTRFSS